MPVLNLRQPDDLAAALKVSLKAWAVRRRGSEEEIAEMTQAAGEIAQAIASDLADRVKPEQIVDGVLQDLSQTMLAMEICDLLLVESLDESFFYMTRAADDPLRVMSEQIATETLAAWPPLIR